MLLIVVSQLVRKGKTLDYITKTLQDLLKKD